MRAMVVRYTLRTGAVEKNLMPGGAKSFWKFELCWRKATIQVKNFAAPIAMEVVVMLLARHFVASCIAGNLHGLQPPLVHEILNVPIDRCDSETSVMAPGAFQSFIRGQRPVHLEECLTDRRFLSCIALFHH
jgi:hypothetical protein